VIGNMDSMEASSPTWKKIIEKLAANDNIGPQLPLKCQVHGDITLVETPDDFRKAPEGGCARDCAASLPKCAHKCQMVGLMIVVVCCQGRIQDLPMGAAKVQRRPARAKYRFVHLKISNLPF